jgi:hypothetical protein
MSAVSSAAAKIQSLYHEVWRCGKCGREFHAATDCCAHEVQCGRMTHC